MKIRLKNPGNEQIDERAQALILIIRFIWRRSNIVSEQLSVSVTDTDN